jgi:hypothetical protein
MIKATKTKKIRKYLKSNNHKHDPRHGLLNKSFHNHEEEGAPVVGVLIDVSHGPLGNSKRKV